ncbi:hypothetical protein INT47_011220 [Mucor saturninus]|uniref:Uncharacterized protein n=1 Tax=Mucor saturninus TaxID=64648 RepID=A0A8H7RKZ5_9FUNG|nr:hypothetical protein INT47_011220 [Mucor saturninus]
MSSELKDIVLEKDAFEETEIVVSEEQQQPDRPDLVEIGTFFDSLAIPDSLTHIAETNQISLPWEELARLLESLLDEQFTAMKDKVQDEETQKVIEGLCSKIIHHVHEHANCPFTIQRLCELIIQPKKYYKMYIKYLRAVDKVLSVTSYWQDFPSTEEKDGATFGVELEAHSFKDAT